LQLAGEDAIREILARVLYRHDLPVRFAFSGARSAPTALVGVLWIMCPTVPLRRLNGSRTRATVPLISGAKLH
jgi:hypothetical protein